GFSLARAPGPGGEPLGPEVPLVNRPPRAVVEDALLDLLGVAVGPRDRVDDDELRCDVARFSEEPSAVVLFEVPVEVAGEDALEGVVVEGEIERVAADELGVRRLVPRDHEHPLALIEADDVPPQMPREEPGRSE